MVVPKGNAVGVEFICVDKYCRDLAGVSHVGDLSRSLFLSRARSLSLSLVQDMSSPPVLY